MQFAELPDRNVDWLFPYVWNGTQPLGMVHRIAEVEFPLNDGVGSFEFGCRFTLDWVPPGALGSQDGDLFLVYEERPQFTDGFE